jgi:OOP family OmpA-OmpF porin
MAMLETPVHGIPTNGSPPAPEAPRGALAELRHLLLGPEPPVDADSVSRVLPEAIRLRASPDTPLTSALLPTVDAAVQLSLRRAPGLWVDALVPLLGPTIRRAIRVALHDLLDSFDRLLERSCSLRALRWHLEARRTGLPFVEVLLRHTLRYRVDYVFLIHRPSGLLLQQAVAATLPLPTAELIAGMLTALQDFARDAFGVPEDEELHAIQIGELTVCVEAGRQAVVAAVVRGHAPAALRMVFQEALEGIQRECAEALASFQGDMTPFAAIQDRLEACLQCQELPRPHCPSLVLWGLGAALLLGLGWWGGSVLHAQHRWAAVVERLRAEPGIVVTTAERRRGGYVLAGLRDPLATDPEQRLRKAGLDPAQVRQRWEPYQAGHPAFVRARATALLAPPPSVELRLEDGVLHAIGAAPHPWIREATLLARTVPGISAFHTAQLVDLTRQALTALAAQIEGQRLQFVTDTTQLVPGQEAALEALGSALRQLVAVAHAAEQDVRVEVIGHTDQSGAEGTNRSLSHARAASVVAGLVTRGLVDIPLLAQGRSGQDPLQAGRSEQDRAVNRRVTFRVVVSERP